MAYARNTPINFYWNGKSQGEKELENRENHSEVAHLLEQIRAEYESACRGMSGFASGKSKHAFISASYDRLGELNDELAQLVGSADSLAMVITVIDTVMGEQQPTK